MDLGLSPDQFAQQARGYWRGLALQRPTRDAAE
jgi:hypothetical protein